MRNIRLLEGFKLNEKDRLSAYDLNDLLENPSYPTFTRREIDVINYWVCEKHIKDIRKTHENFEASLNEIEYNNGMKFPFIENVHRDFVEKVFPISLDEFKYFKMIPKPLVDLLDNKYLPLYTLSYNKFDEGMSYDKACFLLNKTGIYYSDLTKKFSTRIANDEHHSKIMELQIEDWIEKIDINYNKALELIVKKLIINAD